MQGHLTQRQLASRIESVCACCETPIRLAVTSDLEVEPDYEVEGLLLFAPSVDWNRLSAPTIVPDY